eukprot:359258-Chlamydomonas_euryale.AAC.18
MAPPSPENRPRSVVTGAAAPAAPAPSAPTCSGIRCEPAAASSLACCCTAGAPWSAAVQLEVLLCKVEAAPQLSAPWPAAVQLEVLLRKAEAAPQLSAPWPAAAQLEVLLRKAEAAPQLSAPWTAAARLEVLLHKAELEAVLVWVPGLWELVVPAPPLAAASVAWAAVVHGEWRQAPWWLACPPA